MARFLCLLLTFVILFPVFFLFKSIPEDTGEIWQHLIENVLWHTSINTLGLVICVGMSSLFLGTLLAWWVGVFEFPGRKFFRAALLLPLAFPPYVFSFIYLGFFSPSSPDLWWSNFGFWMSDQRFLSLCIVMTLCFYPYVYLLALGAFESQGIRILEVCYSLGMNTRQAFLKACIPAAKPWLLGGLAIVMMEICADFGAVSVFNIDTWTTVIYSSWYSLFSLATAAQLSLSYLGLVILLLLWEKSLQAGKRFQSISHSHSSQLSLSTLQQTLIFLSLSLILALSCLGPILQLILWIFQSSWEELGSQYWEFTKNSSLIAISCALITTFLAGFLAWNQNRHPQSQALKITQFATLGYAIPGTVLAIGAIFGYQFIENTLLDYLEEQWQYTPDSFISDSIILILLGLLSRFFIMAYNPLKASLERTSKNISEAAQSLGHNTNSILHKITLPLMKTGILTGLLMVFIECMKELPISLMTRPFGWDTLSIKVFEWTSEGQWEQSAFPALIIVLLSCIPIWFLSRNTLQEDKK